MLTEDYNGVCPKCGFERCLVRYGSVGWYQFFACPNCEFAFGDNNVENFNQQEVWDSIIEAEGEHLKKHGFELSIKGIKDWVMSMDEPTDRFIITEEERCWSYKIEVKKDG